MRNLLSKQPDKYRAIVEDMKIVEDYVCGNCVYCECTGSHYSEHVCEKTGEIVEIWEDSSNCKYFYT